MNDGTLVSKAKSLSLVWNIHCYLMKVKFCVMYALAPNTQRIWKQLVKTSSSTKLTNFFGIDCD